MNPQLQSTTRRDFLHRTGQLATASALACVAIPHVHAAENNTIQLALIGCGGRGCGAVGDAFAVNNGPVKLVSMADLLDYRLTSSYDNLKKQYGDRVDVPKDRQFTGFDAYKMAMDCLKPGDVAIFTTPPAFRWVHFGCAIEKGLNVFMEKPLTVDGPTTRKMLGLADESTEKNLKVGVGLMVRHCKARQALHERIDAGEIGDLLMLRAYRTHGAMPLSPKPENVSELLYQVQRFHHFLWSGGGLFSDFNIHQIDECSWMKGSWPIKAQANGGRHYHGNTVDQNFDNYSVEYIYQDGARLLFFSRYISGCHTEFDSYAHGTKGSAVISTSVHTPGKCRIYKGQNLTKENLTWAFPQPEPSPYQLEWVDLIDAIRQNTPYNEARRGAEASLVTSMGRMAAHTGQIITYDQILNHDHEFAPGIDQLTMESPAPLQPVPDGKYPVPQPGITTEREY